MVQACMYAVAIVFDLVQPVRTSRRFIGGARELRLDPCWRMSRLGSGCCGLDLAPLNAGSTINCRALWHRGYQGRDAGRFHASTPLCDRLPARPADHQQWYRRKSPFPSGCRSRSQAVMPPAGGSFFIAQRISDSYSPCRTTSKAGGVSGVGMLCSLSSFATIGTKSTRLTFCVHSLFGTLACILSVVAPSERGRRNERRFSLGSQWELIVTRKFQPTTARCGHRKIATLQPQMV